MNDILRYDVNTGEVLEDEVILGRGYVKPFDISVIHCKEDFDKSVVEVLARRKFKLWVSPLLLDVIIERKLSSPALGIYCFLGQSIGYSTYVYLTIKEMSEGSGYVRQTVYKTLDELEEAGLIRKVGNKLKNREDRFYAINPLYFYLGYYPNRENALKDWMMG